MSRLYIVLGVVLGGLTSLAVISFLYLGNLLAGLPFVPFDFFDWLARTLPGDVVTLGIDTIVGLIRSLGLGPTDTTAKIIEQLLALFLVVLVGILLGGVMGWLLHRQPLPRTIQRGQRLGFIAGLILFVLIAAVEWVYGFDGNPVLALGWLAIIYIGWGTILGRLIQHSATTPAPDGRRYNRRQVLIGIATGSLGAVLVAWGIGQLFGPSDTETGAGQALADLPDASDLPATSTPAADSAAVRDRVEPAPGTRPEITPNEDFYRIDINLMPPAIEGSSWMLETAGLFDNPRTLTLTDLMAFPAVTQPLTLSCISNPIGGDLISASNWTGLRLRDLLEELGLQPEARELSIEAEDGFYESVPMDDMLNPRTLLVYGMNGETLPVEHGYPLRIYIPNRYGMKQPKWITRIEAIDAEGPGYWVDRGWSETAYPHIISIIDTVAQDAVTEDNRIPIGGIAWAGNRGIERVEVQVDDGEWVEATLRTPPLSNLIWVQWRYDWPLESGNHTFRVRAVSGDGTLQIGERSGVRPDGATGYHTITATI